MRYGLGGGDPAYLNIFHQNVPVMSWRDNAGKTGSCDPQWRKPAVYLVNGTSRSGKEILAFGAKKYKLATVIGENTAGAVTAGTPLPLSNGDLLYLAVHSSRIDGVVLEGVGVAPDIEAPMDIRFARGKDVSIGQGCRVYIGNPGRMSRHHRLGDPPITPSPLREFFRGSFPAAMAPEPLVGVLGRCNFPRTG